MRNKEELSQVITELIEMVLDALAPGNPDAGIWGIVQRSVTEQDSTQPRILVRLESQIVARNFASELNRVEILAAKGQPSKVYDVVDLTLEDVPLVAQEGAN